MADLAPADLSRRSFLYRVLAEAGARFTERNGAAVAGDFGDPEAERDVARRMGLADLSPLPRTGFKGAGAPDWLVVQGVTLPDAPNQAARQTHGDLVARLSAEEHLILTDLDLESDLCAELNSVWDLDGAARCYQLPRQDSHFWFAVSGVHAPDMFAKICGVDLRPHVFTDGAIAQTSFARINGIAIRDDRGGVPMFHLLADSASADYLWPCLLDAMAEFDGAPVGHDAIRALA